MVNYPELEKTEIENFKDNLNKIIVNLRNFRTNNIELLNEMKLASNQIDDTYGTLNKAKSLVKE